MMSLTNKAVKLKNTRELCIRKLTKYMYKFNLSNTIIILFSKWYIQKLTYLTKNYSSEVKWCIQIQTCTNYFEPLVHTELNIFFNVLKFVQMFTIVHKSLCSKYLENRPTSEFVKCKILYTNRRKIKKNNYR